MISHFFLTFLADELLDGFDRPAALVAVAEVRSFGVVQHGLTELEQFWCRSGSGNGGFLRFSRGLDRKLAKM